MSDTLARDAARLGISADALQTALDAGRGVRAPGVVRQMHVMAKPIGSACNLDCTYCYYLSKEQLLEQKRQRMDDQVLERFIADTIASQDGPEIAFTWHGGEPTLLGVAYFEKIVALQAKHTPAGRRVVNDLQTNGTLLDDEWCAFLKQNDFLVGLSIDGPEALHDRYRPNKSGGGSFKAVFAAAARLRAFGIGFGTLTVVNRHTAKRPLDVYRFLRDEIGSRYMQLIPCVEPAGFGSVAPADHENPVVTEWSVRPQDWGRFLSDIFDEWLTHDRGRVKVNLFESFLAQMRGEPSLMCTSSPFCGKNIAVEHDGRVYACDHYVYPKHEIGRIGEASLSEMVFSVPQIEFGLAKYNTLPTACRACPYLKLCWGECPRTRLVETRPGEGRISYLCEGWKRFFAHAVPVVRRGLPGG